MAYKKTYRKKRPMRKRSRMPFSKRQTNVIRSLAVKSVNKTRECKVLPVHVDEYQVAFAGQGAVRNNNSLNDYVYNLPTNRGTANNYMIGTQIQPLYLHLRGWCKFTGTTSVPSAAECAVRLIAGFVDDQTLAEIETGVNSTLLFYSNEARIATGDYRDIIRGLNWAKIQPVFDRVFKVAPNPNDQNSTSISKLKDYFDINIKHKFSKSQELTLSQMNSNHDRWTKKNLVLLTFSRTMNDDAIITTLAHEFSLEGCFKYYDA